MVIRIDFNVLVRFLLSLFFLSFANVQANEHDFLKSTKYIDYDHAQIVEVTKQVIANLSDDRSKAIAIHNFVRDKVAFGFSKDFWGQSASEVLSEKRGFCLTKSTLFVTMLRAAGIPARQVFVNINSKILQGYLDPGTAYVDHSYTEVLLDNVWVKTDSYILDSRLFHAAQRQLEREGKMIGYGTILGASSVWDGKSDSFSQFLTKTYPELSTMNFGIYEDVGDFYARSEKTINGSWLNRLAFKWFAGKANQQIETLRATITQL